MQPWKGLAIVSLVFLLGAPAYPAPRQAPSGTTGRFVVGLKEPATPEVLKQLEQLLPARIVKVAAGGAYLLVQPNRGVTPRQIEKASPKVSYAEPEVVMGATFRVAREAAGSK